MSRRRSGRGDGNAIRGPQSALTDFLASHNISAAQIRNEYERRVAAAQGDDLADNDDETNDQQAQAQQDAEDEEKSKKRKRKSEAAIAKIKKSKEFKRKKRALAGEPGDDDDDGIAWDMYKKQKPLPGQLENCAECDTRFTVSAYSKEGIEGGLLCPKCSREVDDLRKKEAKQKKSAVSRDKRRKLQSNLLDGQAALGSKSLQELCVEKVAHHIEDIEEFGDLPSDLLDRLSQILSKRRALTSKTLDLFLRPDVDNLAIYDCAKLTTDDYRRIFSIVPFVKKLDLRNAGQFKDSVFDYIMDRNVPLREVRLDAANLVTDPKWKEFFQKMGPRLERVHLSWLDYAMTDSTVQTLVDSCPNLQVLKLKNVFCTSDAALAHIARLANLKQLSLSFTSPVESDVVSAMVHSIGSKLEQLSLHRFQDVGDDLLEVISTTCMELRKLCICDNDTMTDAAYAALFTNWQTPPLRAVNLSRNRSIDSAAPDATDDTIGFASDGFKALMAHSGQRLERLNISSCRHIRSDVLAQVFDGRKTYPKLQDVDLSFVSQVNTIVLAGLFKSCPALQKVAAFGCFDVKDILVPPGVAVIGVPNAQDAIVQTRQLTPIFGSDDE